MPWVSKEEIERAREMTAIEYLKKYQAYRLRKASSRNEWELADHDSFKINDITSKWHWKSRDIGGISALNFLIKVDGMGFVEAVQTLCGKQPEYQVPMETQREKPPFVLPTPYQDCRRILRYLKNRGISEEVLRLCMQRKILYESAPYHNAVFVGVDERRIPRYAFLRGIYDRNGKCFKIEQAGSNKTYAFCVPGISGCKRVAVYEACIDALAHMTLEGGDDSKYRLALGGISAPKEGKNWKQGKLPSALVHFLTVHPEIEEIELCTDNDFAGHWACEHIKKNYENSYKIIENLPQIDGADYADLAKVQMENKRTAQERGR